MHDWWRSAVIYQVYPRSFQDTTGNGVGDLAGITQRLDYIASLNVDVVWLSPIFTSPQDDMGYDISDHCDIDPLFGTLEDFDALLARAHELHLKVIVDQVPSHTSDQHAWFQDSRQSRDAEKADWYVWAEAKPDGSPPNNWLSVFGGPAWTWEPRRKQYYLHSFLSSQPQMNFHNPEVQDAILGTMRFWLERGIDGFRLDSINYPFHDAELRDNPPLEEATDADWVNPYNVQKHIYDKTRPETIGFLQRVRSLMDEYDGTFTVGEVGEGRGAAKIMGDYTKGHDRLHMAYSFEMLGRAFSGGFFRDRIECFFRDAPDGWPCWAFSNHDVIRHVSRWEVEGDDPEIVARQGIALMVSLQGTKCLYQGEELGQTETELSFDEIVDPPGLKFWPEYKGRDGCRTPMVWEHEAPHAGFTEGTPWLPVKPEQAARAVDTQDGVQDSTLGHYRDVLAFYRKNDALRFGNTDFLDLPEPVLAFWRTGDVEVLCLFNMSNDAVELKVEGDLEAIGPGANRLSGAQIELPAHGFGWFPANAARAKVSMV